MLAFSPARRRALLVGGLTVVAGAGCRRRPDAAPGSGPYASIVAEMVPKIEASTGLTFKRPPVLETRSKAQVRDFLLKTVTDSAAQRELLGSSTAYKLFGMLPDTLDLQKLLVNLLTEQVVGFYDPKTKVLYVVDGAKRDVVELTVSHELVHALQDQYVNLDSLQSSTHDSDKKMAAQAVFEGQAMYEQFAASGLPITIPGGWDRVREIIRGNQSSMPVFGNAPFVIQESLLFPYLNGAEFIKNYKALRDNGVPFADMPQSTEQILHASAYFTQRDTPTTVSFAPIPGVTPSYDDDLGEFEIRLLAYSQLRSPESVTAGAGWDGDRYIVFPTAGGGTGLAWASVWDSNVQAATFQTLLQRVADIPNGSSKGRTISIRPLTVAGRPVLLYVNVPRGVDPAIVPDGAVRLR